ncbi:conserved membrane domain protein [Mycobacterium ulcerans str. Harvey]|uniref:Conserved membrane domain protein n=1 Tax=Mycobacterium ulcerans str. Harvey TaxID=1299332 RepID=A0ABN0QN30_MYCUL|nr:conserved membrane domain protein [Mycobacterium ulcerans str. Harvey]
MSPARLPDLLPGCRWWCPDGIGECARFADRARRHRGGRGLVDHRGRGELRGPSRDGAMVRAHLRDLEDGYAAAPADTRDDVATRIVDTSLRFGVLCRFTAYVASELRTAAW